MISLIFLQARIPQLNKIKNKKPWHVKNLNRDFVKLSCDCMIICDSSKSWNSQSVMNKWFPTGWFTLVGLLLGSYEGTDVYFNSFADLVALNFHCLPSVYNRSPKYFTLLW